MSDRYELVYWPVLPGRGEFVRLVLEDAGAAYVDVARRPETEGGGMAPVLAELHGAGARQPAYAPPILKHGDLVLAQMPLVCAYLGERHGLAPEDEAGRWRARQLQLTLADVVAEAHDTHHPVGKSLYYDQQVPEAKKAALDFLQARLPKWLAYFERVLAANGGTYLVGDRTSYVDLSMFQLLTGLEHAFPRGFAAAAADAPGLVALAERVAARPNLAAYLASERRMAFNLDGIFRHYPELDLP